MAFSNVYPHYVAKSEKNNRTKEEVDQIIGWLTGYSAIQLQIILDQKVNFETFLLKHHN